MSIREKRGQVDLATRGKWGEKGPSLGRGSGVEGGREVHWIIALDG